MNGTTTRTLVATAALAAVAALSAGPASALVPMTPDDAGRIPQLGHGLGVQENPSVGAESRAGSTRYGYVVGGELIVPAERPSGRLTSARAPHRAGG